MKHLILVAAVVYFAALPAAAQTSAAPVIVMADKVTWTTDKSLPEGVKIAAIDGDYTKAGWYTVRLMLTDGAKFPIHFHDGNEYVTVLSGTLMAGIGDTWDTTKMVALPAGSYVMMPAKMHHYASAKGDTVIQISGLGPMTETNLK